MAVLDDVRVFGAVEHGDRASDALRSDIVVGWIDGHGHDVDEQVTHKHDARTLTQRSGIKHRHAGATL